MSIKIPMHTFVARQISAFNRLEGEIQEAQSQISLGKTITHASDDPAAASRIWQFESETENLQRYKRGYDIAEIDLSLQSSALQKVSIGLIRAKELALQANSGILNKNDLEVLATEVKELRGGLFDMANLRNSRDQYLFAGVKGDTRPFQEKNGVISFHGDTEKSMTEVMGGRRIVTADSGSEIFMSVPSKNGGRSLFSIFDELESVLMGNHDVDKFRNPQKFPKNSDNNSKPDSHTHEELMADMISSLTTSIEHVTRFEARSGARRSVLLTQRDSIDSLKIDVQSRLADMRDADIASLASRLSQGKIILEAAQAAFAKTFDLSLFKYIK